MLTVSGRGENRASTFVIASDVWLNIGGYHELHNTNHIIGVLMIEIFGILRTNSLSGLPTLAGQINGFDALLSLEDFNSILQLQIIVIPEPSTLALLAAGLVALLAWRFRLRRNSSLNRRNLVQ